MNDLKGKHIWIVGASSGIGKALAHELSNRGAHLILSARRKQSLDEINHSLGGKHHVLALDVADHAAFMKAASNITSLDSSVFLAAAYNPGLIEHIDHQHASEMVDINIKGALHFIQAVYPFFIKQKYGQIILCGSVAGYCGLPHSQPYSATKAAVMSLAQTLYTEAAVHNIDVKLISPGFVETPLTDKNDFSMPLIMKPEEAAKIIADGMLRKKFEIHFPKKFTCIVKLLSWLPYPLFFAITRHILKKKK
jgi:short-subunit dehydrogenase